MSGPEGPAKRRSSHVRSSKKRVDDYVQSHGENNSKNQGKNHRDKSNQGHAEDGCGEKSGYHPDARKSACYITGHIIHSINGQEPAKASSEASCQEASRNETTGKNGQACCAA